MRKTWRWTHSKWIVFKNAFNSSCARLFWALLTELQTYGESVRIQKQTIPLKCHLYWRAVPSLSDIYWYEWEINSEWPNHDSNLILLYTAAFTVNPVYIPGIWGRLSSRSKTQPAVKHEKQSKDDPDLESFPNISLRVVRRQTMFQLPCRTNWLEPTIYLTFYIPVTLSP